MKIETEAEYRKAINETNAIYDGGRALEDLDRLVAIAFAVKEYEDKHGIPDLGFPELGTFE